MSCIQTWQQKEKKKVKTNIIEKMKILEQKLNDMKEKRLKRIRRKVRKVQALTV